MMTLSKLAVGDSARIRSVIHTGKMQRRLWDLGFLPGTQVVCVGTTPTGDPRAYRLRGTVVALRNVDSEQILLQTKGAHGT